MANLSFFVQTLHAHTSNPPSRADITMAVPDRRRALPQQYNSMSCREEDVPSDEEAQDSGKTSAESIFYRTPSSRRRSRSLHSALPRRHSSSNNRPPTLSLNGYESEPSDLSSAASEDCEEALQMDGNLPEPHGGVSDSLENSTDFRACHRRWPFRLVLLLLVVTCIYIISFSTTTLDPDSLLVKKRDMPKAAFSSQHGREVVIQPMEEHSPLRGISKKTYIAPTLPSTQQQKKRRPQVAHARAASKPAPVLMERFVMQDNTAASGDGTLSYSSQEHSRFYYIGCIALVLLVLESTYKEVRRRQGRRRRRRVSRLLLRNE